MFRALLALAGNEGTYAGAPAASAPGQPGLDEVQGVWKHWGLDSAALASRNGKWLAVLGAPVDKSLSARMHNAALRAAGRRERYGALNVPDSPGTFRLVCHAAARIGLIGASVTYPHKTTAAQLAECDDVAKAVGAVNQIRFVATRLEGTNTDATGLRRLLAPHVRPGTTAIVLGAGGSARAAIWALKQHGASVRVASRDAARSKAAVAMADGWIPWTELANASADVWVQATTIGLQDNQALAATPKGARVAVELNYKSGPTRFQAEAQRVGAHVIDGREVVLAQAIDAWRFWFGQEPDAVAMRKALE